MKNWVFALVCILCVTFPIFQVEEHRFQDCYARCFIKSKRNNMLLGSDVCTNDSLRYELDGEHVKCSDAKRENAMGVFRCAVTIWWKEGELAALYSRVFKSTTMIYAILLPSILFGIYQTGSYFSEKRRENKWFEEQTKFTDRFIIYNGRPQNYISKSRKTHVLSYKE